MTNWISVDDRLPDDGQMVFGAYVHNGHRAVMQFSESEAGMGDLVPYEGAFMSWYQTGNLYAQIEAPSHWQPLPEPPESP